MFYFSEKFNFNLTGTKPAIYTIVIFLSLSILPHFAVAQDEIDSMGDPGNNPEWQMNMGVEAFNVGNYQEALGNFDMAIGLMGQTNLDIQYYKAKSYYHLNDLETSLKEIEIFFNLGPDSSFGLIDEMTKLRTEVETTIKSEEEDYKRAINANTVILLDAYIEKHPNGKHIDEIKQKKLALVEDKAYQRAININDLSILQQFLKDYPNSSYKDEIEAAINNKDSENFEKAKTQNTDRAYTEYLKIAVDEDRKKLAEDALAGLREGAEYQKAIKENSIPVYKGYLQRYPEGEHAEEIKKLLSERILESAKRAEKDNKYDVAVDYYDDYLVTFPNAENKSEIEHKRNKAERKSSLDDIPRRSYMQYTFDADATTPTNIGISFGSLRARGGGGFTQVRFNNDISLSPEFDHSEDSTVGSLTKNNSYKLTDNKKVGRFEFLIGFNRAIVRPLWFYAGFGFGYRQVLYDVEITEITGETRTTISENVDESSFGYIWELGVTANLFKFVTLNAGLASFNSDVYYPTFGIGLSWKSKDQTK